MSTGGSNLSPTNSPSIEILYITNSAHQLLKRLTMRTTTLALLCAVAGCMSPIDERQHDDFGADAGVDGSSASGVCDDYKIVTMNLTVSGSSNFNNLPTTCWKLNGKLTITGPAVNSVAKLGDLREVNDLEIGDSALSKFDSKSVVEVAGDIYIHDNGSLADLAQVRAKSTVRSIKVQTNPSLTSIGGLGNASTVTGETNFSNDNKLTTLSLASAQRLEGGLTIANNAALTSISLTSLQSVANLTIQNNALLTNVGSMSSMTNVHGAFTIDNNDSLTTLGALGSSVFVDSNITITNNAKLTDTGSLSHATRVIGVITVSNNLQLDVTKAHDIGCCVQSAGFQAAGNKTNTCNGNHWCLNTQQNCFN